MEVVVFSFCAKPVSIRLITTVDAWKGTTGVCQNSRFQNLIVVMESHYSFLFVYENRINTNYFPTCFCTTLQGEQFNK